MWGGRSTYCIPWPRDPLDRRSEGEGPPLVSCIPYSYTRAVALAPECFPDSRTRVPRRVTSLSVALTADVY